MKIHMVGINHNTAPVAIREKAAVRPGKLDEVLQSLRAHVPHSVILSTCNRTEIYSVRNGDDRPASLEFLRSCVNASEESLRQHTYILEDEAAAEHLFRTACGLDSMILGEYEILGQIKQALEVAEKSGMVNLPLRRVFQNAISTGRRVREETGISKNAFSVSSVAVDLASRAIGNLGDSKLLVIGPGKPAGW